MWVPNYTFKAGNFFFRRTRKMYEKNTDQHCLLNQGVAVVRHILQYLFGGCMASWTAWFRSHSQRINQSLRMLFPNVSQKLMNKTAHKGPLSVYSSDKLWYDLQPIIYLYGLDPIHKCFIHVRPLTIVKPKSQQSTNSCKFIICVFYSINWKINTNPWNLLRN